MRASDMCERDVSHKIMGRAVCMRLLRLSTLTLHHLPVYIKIAFPCGFVIVDIKDGANLILLFNSTWKCGLFEPIGDKCRDFTMRAIK